MNNKCPCPDCSASDKPCPQAIKINNIKKEFKKDLQDVDGDKFSKFFIAAIIIIVIFIIFQGAHIEIKFGNSVDKQEERQ